MARRTRIVLAIALTVAVGSGGIAVWRGARAAPQPALVAPESGIVDPAAADAELLTGVLRVEEWREFGNPVGFSTVPRSRPPGLTTVVPGNPPDLSGGSHRGSGNGAAVDGYAFRAGGPRLFAYVEFGAGPTDTCAAVEGIPHAVCVRNKALSDPSPSDPDLTQLTVYLTADSDAALTGADAERAKKFWADVEMVPAGEATWYTELASRARAAVLR